MRLPLLIGLLVLALTAPPAPAAPVTDEAVLAGGCFWCMEAVFEELAGVSEVENGYAGGHVPNPTYEAVSTGRTGHAESVRIRFDPATIRYRDLLRVFFTVHDPTTGNRQDHDVGPQYRSVIFTRNAEQAATARAIMAEITRAHVFDAPLTTQVVPLEHFYPAEAYHQDYFARNPDQPYCTFVVSPKVEKFKKRWVDRLKKVPSPTSQAPSR